jgi:hypothetical protein
VLARVLMWVASWWSYEGVKPCRKMVVVVVTVMVVTVVVVVVGVDG